MADEKNTLVALKTYTEGKMHRYKLLFAVNGGAFAVGQLILDEQPVGALTLANLAVGAVLFTLLVHADIWAFATMMRNKFRLTGLAFEGPGRAILVMLCALVIAAWSLVIPSWWTFSLGMAGILSTAIFYQRKNTRPGVTPIGPQHQSK